MKKIDLSIVVLSHNTKELLKKCLESVIGGVGGITGVEVIVVDNGSSDGSDVYINELTKLRIKGLSIKIILNKQNLGFAAGNNKGIKEANGRYILFLNSDTEIYPGSLKETIKFMDDNPEVGALSAKTLLTSGEMDPDCHRGLPTPWASISFFLGLEKLFPKSRIFGQYHQDFLNLDENHEIDAGAGAFMMIRKEIIEKVGVWDEKYFFYGEDLDFFYRIKKAGYKIMFYAKPVLIHHKGGSSGIRKESKNISSASRETRLRVAKESIKAMEIFYNKFYKELYPAWLTFLVLLGIRLKGWGRYLKQYFS